MNSDAPYSGWVPRGRRPSVVNDQVHSTECEHGAVETTQPIAVCGLFNQVKITMMEVYIHRASNRNHTTESRGKHTGVL